MEGALAARVPMTYVVEITGELIAGILTTGNQIRETRVVEGLPSGCALIGVRPGNNGLVLTFASAYENAKETLVEHRVKVVLEHATLSDSEVRAAMQGEL